MRAQRLIKLIEMNAENPADTFVIFALGMEYLGQGDKEKAQGYFEQCLVQDESHMASLYQLAILLNNKGMEQEALTLLDRGLLLLKGGKDLKTLNEFRSLREEISF